MSEHNVRAMADVVINHRIGTTKGSNGMYNRYDGIPISWDEHAVTSCSGGKVFGLSCFNLLLGHRILMYILYS